MLDSILYSHIKGLAEVQSPGTTFLSGPEPRRSGQDFAVRFVSFPKILEFPTQLSFPLVSATFEEIQSKNIFTLKNINSA